MKKPAITSTMLADTIHCSQITKSKGVFTFRQGYFYRSGSPEGFANRISTQLTALGIEHTIQESGDKWKPFKGSASVANQSHLFVKVNIIGYTSNEQVN